MTFFVLNGLIELGPDLIISAFLLNQEMVVKPPLFRLKSTRKLVEPAVQDSNCSHYSLNLVSMMCLHLGIVFVNILELCLNLGVVFTSWTPFRTPEGIGLGILRNGSALGAK